MNTTAALFIGPAVSSAVIAAIAGVVLKWRDGVWRREDKATREGELKTEANRRERERKEDAATRKAEREADDAKRAQEREDDAALRQVGRDVENSVV